VFGPDGKVAGCISLILPASRLTKQDRETMAEAVVESARRLSAQLRFEADPAAQAKRSSARRGPTKA
jgi:transcriptional regulator of acetoin/glycerol metabolism